MAIDVIPGEITSFTLSIAIFSGCILFFSYISMYLKERLFLSEAFIAVMFGIFAGPLMANFIDPYQWKETHEVTKQLTRCIIAIQVMAVGIELPQHYLRREWRTAFIFLMPVMIYMWLISGAIIWGLIRPLSFLDSLLISACICPTDPILANSIVKGKFASKHVPSHIRNALAAESGANDGMGFPFLFMALFLIAEDTTAAAVSKWFYITCLFQIALSCIIGVAVGYVARKALQWAERRCLIDKPSFLSFTIALALFLMSLTGFAGSDDLLACFVAGNAFSWDDWFRRETEEANVQEVIDTMLNLCVFVYIGAIIPWSEFNNYELGLEPWRLVVMAFLVLFCRRLPIVVFLQPIMPAIRTYREAVFCGWFGPIGVGAVFLSTIAREELENVFEGREKPITAKIIGPVVLFIVFSSVIIHGSTVPIFKFGKRIRTRTVSRTKTLTEADDVAKALEEKPEENKTEIRKRPKDMTMEERSILFRQIVGSESGTVLGLNRSDSEFTECSLPENEMEPNTKKRPSLQNKNIASSSKLSIYLNEPPIKKIEDSQRLLKKKKEDDSILKSWFFTSKSSSKQQMARRQKEKERKRRKKEEERQIKESLNAEKELVKSKETGDTFDLHSNQV